MTNSLQTITLEISRLPLPMVVKAYNRLHPSPLAGANKSDCVIWLADMVYHGLINLGDIKAGDASPVRALPPLDEAVAKAAPTRKKPTDIFQPTVLDPAIIAKIDAAGATASTAHNDALSALNRIDDANVILQDQQQTLAILTEKLDAISDKVGSFTIDPAVVAQSVAKAVADEFEPFKRAVKTAKAEAIIGDLSSVHIVETKTCAEVFGVDVCDVRGKPLMVNVWNDPSAPAVDPDFIWTDGILRHLLLSAATGENLWFGGEKGTGKSETARQFAARTGRGFVRINFHKHTSAEEYLGATGLKAGETVFEPREFLTAYTSPSTVILLDEVTNADAGELAPLNGFLEPNAAVSFGGQTWSRAKGVLVFVADNTFGSGDDSGRYTGTRTQNVALVDRFSRVIPFTFLPEAFEIDAIVRRTGCTKALADHVHQAVRVARHKVEKGEIVDAPSIRSIMAFIRALTVLNPEQAWETAVVARQPSESHATLRGIAVTYLNPQIIANNL